MVSNLLKGARVEVEVSILSEVTSTKWSLEGVRFLNAKFLPADHSTCALLGFLHAEGTVDVAEDLSLLFKHVRKDSLPVSRVILCAVTIHEDVLFPRVAVEVTEQQYFSLFLSFTNQLLDMEDHRMLLLRGLLPLPVQVLAHQWTSCISQNDSISIDHGHDFEYEVVSKDPCADARANQVVDDALHHVWCSCLSWVDSRTDYDSFLLLHLVTVRECCDRQHICRISRIRLAEHLPSKSVSGLRVIFEIAKVSLQIWICIRVTMSEVYRIVVVLELKTEGKCVIVPRLLLLYRILIVTNVFANSLPAFSRPLCITIGVHQRLHSMIVQTIWLQ